MGGGGVHRLRPMLDRAYTLLVVLYMNEGGVN